ncbi:MAG: hypothetical protein QE509_06055 [Gammaproteobacteria bacterium]|jgi:hypothetical protein|nr:hypothetical protein [Gammaproteobacteria bacterium]
MSGFRLVPQDEYTHTPSAEPNFNESVYLNAFDATGTYGGWMRLGNRVNEGRAELSVCLYLPDGKVACQFLRPSITSNDRHDAGGLRYQVITPLSAVQMNYEGDVMVLDDPEWMREPRIAFERAARLPCSVEFKHEGVSPLHGGEPTDDTTPTMYGRNFSLGHFNQHTRATGHIQVGDQRLSIAGFGWRDHSWGPRYWTNIYFYRLFIGNFGPDRGFMILKITDRNGLTRRCGVLQYDGDYEEITDLDLFTEWTPLKDPKRMQLGVRTAKRAVRIEGEILSMLPLRNRREEAGQSLQSRIAEGFTRWTWDDRTGLGMTEYIEVLENGEPVGYPL